MMVIDDSKEAMITTTEIDKELIQRVFARMAQKDRIVLNDGK